MSVITKIKLNGKNADIYIDNEFFSSLSYFVVRTNRLCEGQEVAIGELDRINMESDIENATEYAYKYLAQYTCTKSKLIEKLKTKEYPYTVARTVADKLEAQGYIDDLAYAERYIEAKLTTRGQNKLRQELYEKGVPSSVISEALANIDSEDIIVNAKNVAQKWYNSHSLDDRKDEEKFYRFMSYRGYSFSIIAKCKDWLKSEVEDDK